MSIALDQLAKAFPKWREQVHVPARDRLLEGATESREQLQKVEREEKARREVERRWVAAERQARAREALALAMEDRDRRNAERAVRVAERQAGLAREAAKKRALAEVRRIQATERAQRHAAGKASRANTSAQLIEYFAWVRAEVLAYAAANPVGPAGPKRLHVGEVADYKRSYARWWHHHRDEALRRRAEIENQPMPKDQP